MSKVRPLEELIARQPPEVLAAADEEYLKLLQEEEDLKSIRQLLCMSQAEIAERTGVHQGAVSKVERKADMTLGTLRSHVESIGGVLDVIVRFPGRRPIRLKRLSGVNPPGARGGSPRVQIEKEARSARVSKPKDHPV